MNFYASYSGQNRDGKYTSLQCYGTLDFVNAVIDAAIGPLPTPAVMKGWARFPAEVPPYDLRIHLDTGQPYPF